MVRLKEFLSAKGIDFVVEIHSNRMPPIDFALYVAGDRLASLAAKGQISPRQMRLIQTVAKKELGLQIEWIVTPSQKAIAIEAALQELLNRRFPGALSAVFVSSLETLPVSIWIERNSEDEAQPELRALKLVVAEFLKFYDVTTFILLDRDNADTPTNPMIIRRLKVISPATTEELAESLSGAGVKIPNVRWLQSKLDALRKQGLVVRSKTGVYCLTELGLSVVPHGKNRNSSDIDRALALARRKW